MDSERGGVWTGMGGQRKEEKGERGGGERGWFLMRGNVNRL